MNTNNKQTVTSMIVKEISCFNGPMELRGQMRLIIKIPKRTTVVKIQGWVRTGILIFTLTKTNLPKSRGSLFF